MLAPSRLRCTIRECPAPTRDEIHAVRPLEKRAVQAETLEKEKRRMEAYLGTLGHELRNALGTLAYAARVLDRPEADARMREWAQQVLGRQVRHMKRLVDDLLDVNRIA